MNTCSTNTNELGRFEQFELDVGDDFEERVVTLFDALMSGEPSDRKTSAREDCKVLAREADYVLSCRDVAAVLAFAVGLIMEAMDEFPDPEMLRRILDLIQEKQVTDGTKLPRKIGRPRQINDETLARAGDLIAGGLSIEDTAAALGICSDSLYRYGIKSERRHISESALTEARSMIDSGVSIKSTAKHLGISVKTLYDRKVIAPGEFTHRLADPAFRKGNPGGRPKIEDHIICQAENLLRSGASQKEAARMVGISRQTLSRRMRD